MKKTFNVVVELEINFDITNDEDGFYEDDNLAHDADKIKIDRFMEVEPS